MAGDIAFTRRREKLLEDDEALVREIYELADMYPDDDAGKLYE